MDNQELDSLSRKQNPWIKVSGLFPPIVWLGIAVIAYGIWRSISWGIADTIDDVGLAAQVHGFVLASYIVILWKIITKV